MASTKSSVPYEESLIISRLQQKELSALKPNALKLQVLSPFTKVELDPFLDQLPIKIGLSLKLLGSRIMSCRVERGFMFENVEQLLSSLSYTQALTRLARLNQRTPIFNQMAYCLAIEALCGIQVDEKVIKARAFSLEFSRVFHHWHVIRDVLTIIGDEDMLDLALTALSLMKGPHDKVARMETPDEASGQGHVHEIKEVLEILHTLAREIDSNVSFDPSIRQYLRKKAVITLSLAGSFGLTGAYLRANRNLYDMRLSQPGYANAPPTQLADGGDAWARFIIRIREILASIDWLKAHPLLESAQILDIRLLSPLNSISPAHATQAFAFGEIDSPEGDTKLSIFCDAKNNKLDYRLRTPSYFIAQALPHLLSQAEIKDLPLILYSLGINAEEIDH